MTAPLVFLDTETTGLAPDDHIWEFAAIRREPDGREEVSYALVQHDLTRAARLPDSFRDDHDRRYAAEAAITPGQLVQLVHYVCRSDAGAPYGQRPHIVGAVPSFDTARLELLMRAHGITPNWHHHLIDVETLAVGWLRAWHLAGHQDAREFPGPPWSSEDLSRAVGVDPDRFERHTACGDVRWVMAIWDRVMGGAPA